MTPQIHVNISPPITDYLKSLIEELEKHFTVITDERLLLPHSIGFKISKPKDFFGQTYDVEFFPHESFVDRSNLLTIGQSLITDAHEIKDVLDFMLKQDITHLKKYFVHNIQIVAIAASTGGPQALTTILSNIPDFVQAPILITQHMQGHMLPSFHHQLKELLHGRKVHLAEQGMIISPKSVYLAPGDHHLTLKKTDKKVTCVLSKGPLINYVCPAADPMFESLATTYPKASVLGVVLTGMGHDGLLGCRSIIEHGGIVIAQDEATSTVYGMPKSVIEAGLAHHVLPLNKIAKMIASLCQPLIKEKNHE